MAQINQIWAGLNAEVRGSATSFMIVGNNRCYGWVGEVGFNLEIVQFPEKLYNGYYLAREGLGSSFGSVLM